LAVHGVVLEDDELEHLARRDVVLVTCPRSNVWTGAGEPPVSRFYTSGGKIAVGTDSLASSPDMNLFNELAVLQRLAPDVSASRLLRSATLDGAQALGFDSDFGSIELGKLASLIAVDIPDNVDDVEKYLVNGFEPDRVRWLESVAWQ
jgi:5-methylthioadenosine/S-adenosylhomocysteine deaminase